VPRPRTPRCCLKLATLVGWSNCRFNALPVQALRLLAEISRLFVTARTLNSLRRDRSKFPALGTAICERLARVWEMTLSQPFSAPWTTVPSGFGLPRGYVRLFY